MYESSGDFKKNKGTRLLLDYECPLLIFRYWDELKQKDPNSKRRFTIVCLDPDSLSTNDNNINLKASRKKSTYGFIDANSKFMSISYEDVCQHWIENYDPGEFFCFVLCFVFSIFFFEVLSSIPYDFLYTF